MEELNKKIPQLPWIIAVVGIVVAGWFFLSASKVNTEISDRQCELNAYNLKLAQYKKLEAIYGHGSDKYYADKPLLILKPEGEEKKIIVYCGDIVDKTKQHAIVNEPTKSITAEWLSWYGAENSLIALSVKPGNKTGCYPIDFTNNVNDDKFQVLVVVK